MQKTRNRLTPFLEIILMVLIGVLFFVTINKMIKNGKIVLKRFKLDDPLIQELYLNFNDEDIKYFSTKNHSISSLDAGYIFTKATSSMTIEDIELGDNTFKISYDSLDSAIKTTFGPDFKYDLSSIKGEFDTYFEIDDKIMVFNIRYDKANEEYIGNYTLRDKDTILVKKELVQAYKNRNLKLKVGYVFYKLDGNYKICDDSKCEKIVKEVDDIEKYDYKDFVTISLRKSSDEAYYYVSNN